MSDGRETQGEEVVPEGFMVLHYQGTPRWIRAADVVLFAPDMDQRGCWYLLRGDDAEEPRICDESPSEIAALIDAARGGGESRSEAEKVVKWLEGEGDSGARVLSCEDSEYRASAFDSSGANAAYGRAPTALAAIAAAEADRNA